MVAAPSGGSGSEDEAGPAAKRRKQVGWHGRPLLLVKH